MAVKVRHGALGAARDALQAAHAASGLSVATSPEATRLFRAAEGLVRAAIAVLGTPEPPVFSPLVASLPAVAPNRRRRQRGRGGAGWFAGGAKETGDDASPAQRPALASGSQGDGAAAAEVDVVTMAANEVALVPAAVHAAGGEAPCLAFTPPPGGSKAP
jgi:hypothetical protein